MAEDCVMSFSLKGQDIDEVGGNLSLLGFNLVNLTLNGKVVWIKRAKGGSITVEHGSVIEETGTGIGTVSNQGNGNFLFTPPADLYTATVNAHGAGGGGGGGESGDSYGGNDGQGGEGGKAGSTVTQTVNLTPHVSLPMFIPEGGTVGQGAGSGDNQDGYPGGLGGTATFSSVITVGGGRGGSGGGVSGDGSAGEDSPIGTGGYMGSGDGQPGGAGGPSAGGGGGSGGDGDSFGEGENGGDGGKGGTGRIEIIW